MGVEESRLTDARSMAEWERITGPPLGKAPGASGRALRVERLEGRSREGSHEWTGCQRGYRIAQEDTDGSNAMAN